MENVCVLVLSTGRTVSVKTALAPSGMLALVPNLRFALPPGGTMMFELIGGGLATPAISKLALVIVTLAAPTLRTVTCTAVQLVPEHRAYALVTLSIGVLAALLVAEKRK
jgi:hypothetical protein